MNTECTQNKKRIMSESATTATNLDSNWGMVKDVQNHHFPKSCLCEFQCNNNPLEYRCKKYAHVKRSVHMFCVHRQESARIVLLLSILIISFKFKRYHVRNILSSCIYLCTVCNIFCVINIKIVILKVFT